MIRPLELKLILSQNHIEFIQAKFEINELPWIMISTMQAGKGTINTLRLHRLLQKSYLDASDKSNYPLDITHNPEFSPYHRMINEFIIDKVHSVLRENFRYRHFRDGGYGFFSLQVENMEIAIAYLEKKVTYEQEGYTENYHE